MPPGDCRKSLIEPNGRTQAYNHHSSQDNPLENAHPDHLLPFLFALPTRDFRPLLNLLDFLFFGLAFRFDLRFTTLFFDSSTTLPTPENVALGVGPNTSGCGDGAALHESPDVHAGADTGAREQGDEVEHTWAS
jgi:hypothetical protein